MPKGSYGHVRFSGDKAYKCFIQRREDIYGTMAIKEIDFMKRCNHPNIVKIEDIKRVDDKNRIKYNFDPICISMRRADCTLHEYYKKRYLDRNPFSNEELRDLIHQMLLALCYIHANKICHKDIKPNNFLMFGNNVKLSDFGLASMIEVDISECCIERYRAPEILKGKLYNYGVDIWALGCIIYEMSTGKSSLFAGNTSTDIFESIINTVGISSKAIDYLKVNKKPMSWNLQVNPLLEELLKGMLNTDPDLRLTANQCLNLSYFRGKGTGYFYSYDQIFLPYTKITSEFCSSYYGKFHDKEILLAVDMLKRVQIEKNKMNNENGDSIFKICLYIAHKIVRPLNSIKRYDELFGDNDLTADDYLREEIKILEILDYKVSHFTLFDAIDRDKYNFDVALATLLGIEFEHDYGTLIELYSNIYEKISKDE